MAGGVSSAWKNYRQIHSPQTRLSPLQGWVSGVYTVLSLTAESAVQLLSRVRLFATPWTAARQASLSFPVQTISESLLKLMSIEPVMPSNHLILCRPLLLPPSIFPRIRAFSSESALLIRWPARRSNPVSPKGSQPSIFIGRTVADAKAEAPVLWLPDAKDLCNLEQLLVLSG